MLNNDYRQSLFNSGRGNRQLRIRNTRRTALSCQYPAYKWTPDNLPSVCTSVHTWYISNRWSRDIASVLARCYFLSRKEQFLVRHGHKIIDWRNGSTDINLSSAAIVGMSLMGLEECFTLRITLGFCQWFILYPVTSNGLDFVLPWMKIKGFEAVNSSQS